jgi:hypothetical protein
MPADRKHSQKESGNNEATNQLRSLRLAGMIKKPRRHLTEVPANAKL